LERTYEPLNDISTDDTVTCAKYCTGHGISHEAGWKRFKLLDMHQKKLICMAMFFPY